MRMTRLTQPNGKNVYVDLDSVVRVSASYDAAPTGGKDSGTHTELSLSNGSSQTILGNVDEIAKNWWDIQNAHT